MYRPEPVDEAGRAFDAVVRKTEGRDFRIVRAPETKVCKECDLRGLCEAEGVFSRGARGRTAPSGPARRRRA